ncbi:tetratricopeptide repeat protein [Paenisporosarcina cavernae]|nr:hypothetical protein [Paenisporosarcina cavernae]
MKKENKSINNLVLFPGTAEKYLVNAKQFAESGRFEEAIECFEQASALMNLEEADLFIYAVCLFEMKELLEAKEVVENILQVGSSNYVESIELYVSILMELRNFKDVVTIIEPLLEENILPFSKRPTFLQLLDLSKRLMEKKQVIPFEIEKFTSWTELQQQQFISDLTKESEEASVPILMEVAGHSDLPELSKSFALMALVELKVSNDVDIIKFGKKITVTPAELDLPIHLETNRQVLEALHRQLAQHPDFLEMAEEIVIRHFLLCYPNPISEEEPATIASRYTNYIESLFISSGVENFEKHTPILDLERFFESRIQ